MCVFYSGWGKDYGYVYCFFYFLYCILCSSCNMYCLHDCHLMFNSAIMLFHLVTLWCWGPATLFSKKIHLYNFCCHVRQILHNSYLYADSGRRNSNQSRRSLQVPEHDGLLGSGSFPRPSGFAAGVSAPKIRPNEHYQLNRSNEPYHPPRPYKVRFVFKKHHMIMSILKNKYGAKELLFEANWISFSWKCIFLIL